MKKAIMLAATLVFTIFLTACASDNEVNPKYQEEAIPVISHTPIYVNMINTEGVKVGNATVTETTEGVKILLEAEGLDPGTKAIHLHQTGKCEAPDFKSAGGHYNPGQREHGFDNPRGFHAGDLPNIEVTEKGTVNVEITAPNVTLKQGEKNTLLDEDGSALVIHVQKDDYKTNPAGNAGDRIVCGVIKK
ncbi:Cu-Zn family superoxide dismutase [Lederbergia wuyishanensis]|uniref:Superoxide dismutase [Cu-Zn] n=1 Tax=Lederbergia wuyishanensis TaxID=1347903 RepID=A0ABU0DAW2_9BACI|nr:superoxide dismutase family protein [Lederbergia wuyishanensis]MCJ8010050.1 superoxide dismutase family protein [Lederbergia wuyishanensis]MDQ0345564.1 Cu-Zn family superoxide dismutase [Lederbergia wuyishanensis]